MSATGVRRMLPVGVLACLQLAVMAASTRAQPAGESPAAKDDEKLVLPVILPEFSPTSTSKPAHPRWLPEGMPLPPGTPVWVPEAVVGILVSLILGALVIVSAWRRPRLPQQAVDNANNQFCAEFLALPKKVQSIFYQQLIQGERVLWAAKASSRLCRRNLGLVIFIGFSILSVIVAFGRAKGWDDGLPIAALFVFCLTAFFAYLSLELPGTFMLTDLQAYALYQVPAGDFVFVYDAQQMAPVLVSKAWLLPRAGNVIFGTAKAGAERGQVQGDPGPCGFQRIDDPVHVAQLAEAVVENSVMASREAIATGSRIGRPSSSHADTAEQLQPQRRPEEMFHFE